MRDSYDLKIHNWSTNRQPVRLAIIFNFTNNTSWKMVEKGVKQKWDNARLKCNSKNYAKNTSHLEDKIAWKTCTVYELIQRITFKNLKQPAKQIDI